MILDQIKKIVEQGESNIVEFKKSTGVLRAAFETVCAFLNGDGGILLIGVTDNGKIVGQEVCDRTRQEIAHAISELEPPAQAQISVVYIPIERDSNKKIIAIKVKAGQHIPYTFDGRAFHRIQSTSPRMPQHRYEQLIVQRGQLDHSWESVIVPEYSINDLDQELIKKTINRAVEKRRLEGDISVDDLNDILDKFHLLKNNQLTRASIILFCRKERKQFIQSQLRLARFKGVKKEEFIDNKIYRGNIFYLYDQAMIFLNNYLPISGKIENETPVRVDTPAIPVKVLRESIINGLAHRDYGVHGGAVNIAVYDDKVEINSSGGLPMGMTAEKLKTNHSSFPRNPLIAEVLHAAGYIEMWGRGLEKIINLSKIAGNPEPEFEVTDTDFTVRLQLKEPIVSGVIINDRSLIEAKLNIRQKNILEILRKYDATNIQQIMTELKNPPSKRMVSKDLSYLKTLDVVEIKGSKRGALWVLKKR